MPDGDASTTVVTLPLLQPPPRPPARLRAWSTTRADWALELWLILCVLSVALLFTLDELLNGNDVWGPLPADFDPETAHHWCERIVPERLVRSPANGYSSLAFVFAAWGVVSIGLVYQPRAARNHLRYFVPFTVLQAVILFFGGVGALLAHAHAGPVDAWPLLLDYASVWPLVAMPALLFAVRFIPLETTRSKERRWVYWVILVAFLALLIALVLPVILGQHNQWVDDYLYTAVPVMAFMLPSLLVARLVVEALGWLPPSSAGPALIVLSLTFSVVAYLLQDPDRVGVCSPASSWFLNTHLWWHVLQSISLFLVWYWCFFEDVADAAFVEARKERLAQRGPRLRLLPDIPRLFLEP